MIQFQNNTKKFKKSNQKAISKQNGIVSKKYKIDFKKFSSEKKTKVLKLHEMKKIQKNM